jgi:LPXTG-motif cell wall-anchored protein
MDGLVSAGALGVDAPVPALAARARSAFFSLTELPDVSDVDASDNSDEFTVFVAAAPELPDTGASIGLYAGTGGALVIVGGLLLLMTRRRRVAST